MTLIIVLLYFYKNNISIVYRVQCFMRFLCTADTPFTLTIVNNTPHVEGNDISISFKTSKPVYSATCYLGRDLRKDCTTGHVEFTDVRPASYAFRVVALDKERFGHKIIERRTIHVLGKSYGILLASSPGPSQLFNETLKRSGSLGTRLVYYCIAGNFGEH